MTEPMLPAEAPQASNQNRKLLLAGAGAAVVGVGVVIYVLTSSGGGSQSLGPVAAAHHVAATPTASAAASIPAAAGATAVPAAYSGPIGRNPFSPLATEPPPPTTSPTPTTSPSPAVTPTPSATPSIPIVVPTVTVTPSPTGLPTAGAPLKLTLVSVDTAKALATVSVDDGSGTPQQFVAKPGQVFDKYFKLVSILSSDPSVGPVQYGADFEYGDQFVQLAVGSTAQVD